MMQNMKMCGCSVVKITATINSLPSIISNYHFHM